MLFLWFHATVRLPGNEVGSVLGKIKSEVSKSRRVEHSMDMSRYQYVIPWLKSVVKEHHELVVALLLPHPIEYAKVGGVWYVVALRPHSHLIRIHCRETMSNRTTQIIESLNKLYDLMPDNIINFEVHRWSHCISNENTHHLRLLFVADLGLHDALLDGIDSTRNTGE